MQVLKALFIIALAMSVTACSSKNSTYIGPEVTRVVVLKEQRKMYLLHKQEVLKAYNVDLGFSPVGHKETEGDGRTPEGSYYIDRRNAKSAFHRSIGISYPNARDLEKATSIGAKPGGDIFIHGGPRPFDRRGKDWTAGCISVTNEEIETVYKMVRDGTQVDILP